MHLYEYSFGADGKITSRADTLDSLQTKLTGAEDAADSAAADAVTANEAAADAIADRNAIKKFIREKAVLFKTDAYNATGRDTLKQLLDNTSLFDGNPLKENEEIFGRPTSTAASQSLTVDSTAPETTGGSA